jgi:hypothetical protein
MTLSRMAVAAAVLLLVLAAAYFGIRIGMGRARPEQPIVYSHKAHITTAGATCTDCHQHVEKGAAASIPDLAVCQTCHGDEPLSKSPEETRLQPYLKEGKEIPWRKIYKVPDHVYFSHRRHVVDGGIDCASCHGTMAEMTVPVSYQVVPVTMDNCVNCHRQRKVSTDCLTCHR